MSRIFVTVSKPHKQLIPVLTVTTADHTGGSYSIGGLHPASIAAIAGAGPKVEIKPGERFDVRFNANKVRTAFTLVINTTKHIPHLEWSSATGLGELPLGLSAIAPSVLLKNGGKAQAAGKEDKTKAKPVRDGKGSSARVRRVDRRESRSTRSSDSGHSRKYVDRYEVEECDEGYSTDGEGYYGRYDHDRQIEQDSRRHRGHYEIEETVPLKATDNSRRTRDRSERRFSRDGPERPVKTRRQIEEKPFVEQAGKRQRYRRQSEDNPHRHPKYQKQIEDVPERRPKASPKSEDNETTRNLDMYKIEEQLNMQRKDRNTRSKFDGREKARYQLEEDDDGYESEYDRWESREPSKSRSSDDGYGRGREKRASRTSSRSRH